MLPDILLIVPGICECETIGSLWIMIWLMICHAQVRYIQPQEQTSSQQEFYVPRQHMYYIINCRGGGQTDGWTDGWNRVFQYVS